MKKIKIIDILCLTIAGIINAIGVTLFIAPVSLYDSGISGTSILLSQLFPKVSLSLFLLILNIPLFIFGYKKQGKVFTLYSIYVVCIYSLAAFIINNVLPIDVTSSPFAGNDLVLCAIFGGIISGCGSGLAIRFGGAMDGVEVMAVIFAKRIGITVGSFVMAYNVLLYVIAGIAHNSYILPLYSIITYMAGLKTVDFIVEGFDRAKSAMIITERPKEVSELLMQEFGIGVTKIEAKGGYSNNKKTIVYIVVNRFQIGKLRNIVHEIDESAFISISEVSDIFSKNISK